MKPIILDYFFNNYGESENISFQDVDGPKGGGRVIFAAFSISFYERTSDY